MRFIVDENGFDVDTIRAKNGKEVEGRVLDEKARVAIANVKYALKYYDEYAIAKKDNPSGKKVEDMLLFVRHKMFKQLRGKINMKGNKKAKEVEEEEMPSNYIFSGYMAFALFGPMGLSQTRLSAFTITGTDVTKKGRKKLRAEASKQKDEERRATVSTVVIDVDRGGVSGKDKAAAAHLAQQSLYAEQRNVRELLNYANNDHRTTVQELQVVCTHLREAEKNLQDRGYLAGQITEDAEVCALREMKTDIFERLAEVKNKKRALESQSEILLPKRQSTATREFIRRAGLPSTQPEKNNLQDTPPCNQQDQGEGGLGSISFNNRNSQFDDQSSMMTPSISTDSPQEDRQAATQRKSKQKNSQGETLTVHGSEDDDDSSGDDDGDDNTAKAANANKKTTINQPDSDSDDSDSD